MCEQSEIVYLDGEVVWVKLGSCWWPGEVVDKDKLPPDVLPSFRKPPIACVKFFQEDAYEFVKNSNNIYKYNCSRKNEFINKGLYLFRSKHAHMEKFPDDVIRAETAVGGDIEILTRDEFQETKKESYAGLFGNPKKTPASTKKGKGRGRPPSDASNNTTPHRQLREKTDYKVHILVQGSKTPPADISFSEVKPSKSAVETTSSEDKNSEDNTENKIGANEIDDAEKQNKSKCIAVVPATPLRSPASTMTPSSSGIYACHACPFTTTRLNVLILHNKTHSVSFVPYTPTPIKKKLKSSVKTKSTPNTSKSVTVTPKTSKPRKPRVEKTEIVKKAQSKKRVSQDDAEYDVEAKKSKTDEEIKSKLLADWDDDVEDDSNDESTAAARSPGVPAPAHSPAEPTPAELPAHHPPDTSDTSESPNMSANIDASPKPANSIGSPKSEKPSSPFSEKPESSDSKYEFCEDEDWPLETDFGRKIPRVKNPVRADDVKSVGLDEDEVAREVAELLNKTAVPELPAVPEPLRVEENFPEPPIVKSPDKSEHKEEVKSVTEKPTKAIFKTKTFFRSRHSRSQDAIGKYVAEQLNAVERMDISESDVNGSEAASSPEARDSPPIEPVKVARLAPKIQLKKMKLEAAQLREKEKLGMVQSLEILSQNQVSESQSLKDIPHLKDVKQSDANNSGLTFVQDVLYPTQEIKPLNEVVMQEKLPHKDMFSETDVNKTTDQSLNHDTFIMTHTSQASHKIDEKVPQEYEKLMKLSDNLSELEKEICNNGEVVIQSSLYQNTPTECETVTTNTTGEIPESTLEKESLEINDKSNVHEVEMDYQELISDQPTNLNSQASDDLNVNKDSKSEEAPKTAYLEGSLEDKQNIPSESLRNCETKSKPQDKVSLFMNESTASAVDALLSVSREKERVPRIVSNDLPEDLFEDDKEADNNDHMSDTNNIFENKIENQNSSLNENHFAERLRPADEVVDQLETAPEAEHNLQTAVEETSILEETHHKEPHEEVPDNISSHIDTSMEEGSVDNISESVPSESDLQVAEALINLPATAIQNTAAAESNDGIVIPFTFDHEVNQESMPTSKNVQIDDTETAYLKNEAKIDKSEPVAASDTEGENLNVRFESEQEKCENLNAAQSLVEMSESIEHKINIAEQKAANEEPETGALTNKTDNGIDNASNLPQKKVNVLSNETITLETPKTSVTNQSPKLLKMLEEPFKPKIISKLSPVKQIVQGKEKILNFDVAKSSFNKNTQKIIIRRNPTANKTVVDKVESGGADKIILSRSGAAAGLQRYTIHSAAPGDAATVIIQQKVRKLAKPALAQPKLQKIKPAEPAPAALPDEAMFDINSMPIVLSEDLLTAESLDSMPVVMSEPPPPAPALVKPQEAAATCSPKPEVKTLLLNSGGEMMKSATPNILSKSSKLRAAKSMVVIDKATGKQKCIVMKPAESAPKEVMQTSLQAKPPQTIIQPKPPQQTVVRPAGAKTEKFIIVPQTSAPRPARTQKIVIDPATGKAHMFVAKGSDSPVAGEVKPAAVRAQPASDPAASGTVMIITNAQGAQSRIVLTPRHEKILFPDKRPQSATQPKPTSQRIAPSVPSPAPATVTVTAAAPAPAFKQAARIVPKQGKSAIITSKGQLIVGGRVTAAAPLPELRPARPRRAPTEPARPTQRSSEPIILLQQKSGAMMQLTAAQFEHLQRTGQIVQKTTAPAPDASVSRPRPALEPVAPVKRIVKRAGAAEPAHKKPRHELVPQPALAPAPQPSLAAAPPAPVLVPALAPALSPALPPAPPALLAPIARAEPVSAEFSELENFEELLPSTAIARQPVANAPSAVEQPGAGPPPEPAAAISEQILAVPGEHFGALAGTFYLCVEENGAYTPIDNRPLVLERDQLVPAPERRDILQAALHNSDVLAARDDAPDFRDLNANVSVHCRVSETSALEQPIMCPAEVPSAGARPAPRGLEAGLAAIGAVPSSRELPITVTDPRIAPPAVRAPPDDEPAPKSMPILTEDAAPLGALS